MRARAAEGESARDVAIRAAAALEAHLARHHATIAAFIVEPLVQGASGMAMHDPHYLALARELCTRYDVLLDRRRDHDGVRPHRNDVRLRRRPESPPT